MTARRLTTPLAALAFAALALSGTAPAAWAAPADPSTTATTIATTDGEQTPALDFLDTDATIWQAVGLPTGVPYVVELHHPDGSVTELTPDGAASIPADGAVRDTVDTAGLAAGDYVVTLHAADVTVSSRFTIPTAAAADPVISIHGNVDGPISIDDALHGLAWHADGLPPGAAYSVELQLPDGWADLAVDGVEQTVAADGNISGLLQFVAADSDTAGLRAQSGVHTLTVTVQPEGDVEPIVLTGTFTLVEQNPDEPEEEPVDDPAEAPGDEPVDTPAATVQPTAAETSVAAPTAAETSVAAPTATARTTPAALRSTESDVAWPLGIGAAILLAAGGGAVWFFGRRRKHDETVDASDSGDTTLTQ